jgi:spore maturation protein A
MLNYIWTVMLLSGFAIGVLNGRIEAVTNAALSSAGRAVELGIGLLGIVCLWSGLMKIMEKSGLVDIIAKLARPVLKPLFPQIRDNGKALGAVVLNLAANFMGLGNAATPLGIKAMIELQKANGKKDTASDAMCMFLVLNTSAIQLIPSTVIALRNDAGSAAPAEITTCVWFASVCATLTGVFMARLMSGMSRTRGRMYAGRIKRRAA